MRIANSKGVPSTLGCIARSAGMRGVLLTTWHALFGRGASWRDVIWLVEGEGPGRRYTRLGATLQGKLGLVRYGGDDCFVDCAIGSCPAAPALQGHSRAGGHDTAARGSVVTKTGAATGTTAGVVVEADYCGSVLVDGRVQPVRRQLLVRASDGRPFSAEGDSGALILNSGHKAVGLLWGINTRGDGVACHIGPVLQALSITLGPSPP